MVTPRHYSAGSRRPGASPVQFVDLLAAELHLVPGPQFAVGHLQRAKQTVADGLLQIGAVHGHCIHLVIGVERLGRLFKGSPSLSRCQQGIRPGRIVQTGAEDRQVINLLVTERRPFRLLHIGQPSPQQDQAANPLRIGQLQAENQERIGRLQLADINGPVNGVQLQRPRQRIQRQIRGDPVGGNGRDRVLPARPDRRPGPQQQVEQGRGRRHYQQQNDAGQQERNQFVSTRAHSPSGPL